MTKIINIFNLDNNDTKFRGGILLLQILQIILFLSVMLSITSFGPTLDDSWIHYQFSRNIAEHGEVSFNTGEWSIGTTSLLWDLILAVGIFAGIPVVYFSLFLGIILYFIFAQLVITIFRSYWEKGLSPMIAALIVVLSGNLLWYALSGMETMMMLVLALLWVIVFSRNKFIAAGIITGLIILTRIEGIIFLAMGLFFVIRNYGIRGSLKPAGQLILFTIPFMFPTILLNLVVAGEIYPTTMAGKKWLYGLDDGFINTSPLRAVKYIAAWLMTFLMNNWLPEFMDHPMTVINQVLGLLFPGRMGRKALEPLIEPYSYWTQLVIILVGVFLYILIFIGGWITLKQSWKKFWTREKLDKIDYLLIYFICLNLLYLLVLPVRGHGGRYQAVNFVMAGFFLIIGIEESKLCKKYLGQIGRKIIIIAITVLYLAGNISWSKLYANTVLHVNNVHVAAGKWLKENLPPDTVIGVFDVGAIKYHSQLPVVDIAGLTDREVLQYVLDGNVLDILSKRKAEYLVMVEDYMRRSKRRPVEEPFTNSAYYGKLGIYREIGKSVNLELVKKFSIPMETWIWHWSLLKTHSPMIAVYKIRWINENPDNSQNIDNEIKLFQIKREIRQCY